MLDKEQKIFIQIKVQKLGNLDAVKLLYHKDCEVDAFALEYANSIYLKEKKEWKKD